LIVRVSIVVEWVVKREQKMKNFREYMIRKRYSPRTIESYTALVQSLLTVLKQRDPSELDDQAIGRYITKFYVQAGHSRSYQNQAVNALKLYYRIEFKREIEQVTSLRPKRETTLPNVLSQEEVGTILRSFNNDKHRTIFYVIYSGGLRISEAINLKISDIDSKRGVIRIRNSKGAKDREVPLSQLALEQLRKYFKIYRPKEYLFNGQYGGQYSTRSIQALFRKALSECGIKRSATVHTLRHSYATHLLENGTDLRIIQELLGHKSSKTTEIYTHVSQRTKQRIPNPLDQLKL